jgi:hypothetical protein
LVGQDKDQDSVLMGLGQRSRTGASEDLRLAGKLSANGFRDWVAIEGGKDMNGA